MHEQPFGLFRLALRERPGMLGERRVRAEHQHRHDPCLRKSRPAASTPPYGVILAMLGQALRVAPRGHGRGGIRTFHSLPGSPRP